MQAFAAELRSISRKHTLLGLKGKDYYRNNRHNCEFRKNVRRDTEARKHVVHDTKGRGDICTHSVFEESPYAWACRLSLCPFISLGIKQAYAVRANEREKRNERKRLAQG